MNNEIHNRKYLKKFRKELGWRKI